jgi:hypothetical protein
VCGGSKRTRKEDPAAIAVYAGGASVPSNRPSIGGVGSPNGIISAVDHGSIRAPTVVPGGMNNGFVHAPGIPMTNQGYADRVGAPLESQFGRIDSTGSVASQDTIVAPELGTTASTQPLRPPSASSPLNTVVQSPSAAAPWFNAEDAGNIRSASIPTNAGVNPKWG